MPSRFIPPKQLKVALTFIGTVAVVIPAETNNSGATLIETGVVSTKPLIEPPDVPPAETLSALKLIRL